MSKNMDDFLRDNSQAVELSSHENKFMIHNNLQNPFFIIWSKLVSLIQPAQNNQPQTREDNQSEEYRPDIDREQYLYRPLTDRIDPSLYYTIFHDRF